jgi:hypothetical protein
MDIIVLEQPAVSIISIDFDNGVSRLLWNVNKSKVVLVLN